MSKVYTLSSESIVNIEKVFYVPFFITVNLIRFDEANQIYPAL